MRFALLPLSVLVNPTGVFLDDGGDGIATLTFAQDMNTVVSLSTLNFRFRDINGAPRLASSLYWATARILKVEYSGVSSYTDPLYLDYLNLSGALKTAVGESYPAWNDVILTDVT